MWCEIEIALQGRVDAFYIISAQSSKEIKRVNEREKKMESSFTGEVIFLSVKFTSVTLLKTCNELLILPFLKGEVSRKKIKTWTCLLYGIA